MTLELTPTEKASRRGRSARVKGRNFTAEIRRAWEATIGPVVATQQELGADDLLDVVNGISIECKNQRAMTLAAWVDQAATQATNRGGLIPVVVHKRVGSGDVGRYYVTLELRFFMQLLLRLKRGGS